MSVEGDRLSQPETLRPPRVWSRVARYLASRLFTIVAMVVIAVALTLFVANMGGYVDEIIRSEIRLAIAGMRQAGWLNDVAPAERNQIIEETVWAMDEAQGLHQPLALRSVRWLERALTLRWGPATRMGRIEFRGVPTNDVRYLVLDALPRTLLLFGLANLLLFLTSVAIGLAMTRQYGGWLDRVVAVLTPLSAAPPWVYGIILTVIAIQVPSLRFVTASFNDWPDTFEWSYVPLILRHMLVPTLAIFLSKLFQSVYTWRTFFLIYRNEDYAEVAKAKGLPDRQIERRYILRPALPSVLTHFALLLSALWQEVIVLEYFFSVEGIGRLFIIALRRLDIPVTLAIVVTFAYLLALTVFLLDIAYLLVDPRVRVGREATLRTAARRLARSLSVRERSLSLMRGLGARLAAWRPATAVWRRARQAPRRWAEGLRQASGSIGEVWRELRRYPAAVVGLSVIVFFFGVAIYGVVTIPYQQAIALWRGDRETWYRYPQNALPEWVDFFTGEALPHTLVLDSREGDALRESTSVSEGVRDVTLVFPIDYDYDHFPPEMTLFFHTAHTSQQPHVSMMWHTPDGREIRLTDMGVRSDETYRFDKDERLVRRLGHIAPQQALFADPGDAETPLKGHYELRIEARLFNDEAELEAEFVVFGEVHGLAGTDERRRDLMVAVLWGTFVALAFGISAAASTTLVTMVLAAAGAWFGGWVDQLIQRVTEVNMVLPFLPVSLMIFTLYSKSIWVILGVTVLLSIFGSGLKGYRAAFLQIREAPYVEAAQAYGAGHRRIIARYLIPRLSSVLVPQFITLIPGFVFLEAALAFLGMSDPRLPTWGQLVYAAFANNVFQGPYHLVALPAAILLILGLSFALVGYALEKILNPQLRSS